MVYIKPSSTGKIYKKNFLDFRNKIQSISDYHPKKNFENRTIFERVQSITKKHEPPVFQPYVFPVYLRNRLTYKKSIYIFLYQFLKSSPLEQEFSKFDDTIS